MLRNAMTDLQASGSNLKIVFEAFVIHTSLGVPGIPEI